MTHNGPTSTEETPEWSDHASQAIGAVQGMHDLHIEMSKLQAKLAQLNHSASELYRFGCAHVLLTPESERKALNIELLRILANSPPK